MLDKEHIQAELKDYILKEFLAGEDPEELTDSTPLVSSGILDSLATLQLISFLEKKFNINVQAHEADEENFNTIESISNLVAAKL